MNSAFESFVEKRRYSDFVARLKRLVLGYAELEETGKIGEHALYKIVVNPKGIMTICFIAGIHGDEEAGPLSVLAFLRDKMRIPDKIRIVIIPMVNPTGYEANRRRNDDSRDVNRHFLDGKPTAEGKILWKALIDEPIKLVVTLHEDPKARRFYLYYTKFKNLAELLRDMASKYFPVHKGPQIRNDKGSQGLIPPPHKETGTIEDKFTKRGIPYFTTEPPGTEPLAKRVKFMREAIKLVVHNF